MKYLILILLFLLPVVGVFAEYPPEGWTASITEAVVQAETEDKMILMDFTGSDWCPWCFRLKDEVWNTEDFKEWANDNLVRLFLDFPREIELSEEQQQQNAILQQYFGVQGYPTVFLLDSNLQPLLKTGYRPGGAAEYIRHLSEDRNLNVPEEFQQEFRNVIETYIGPLN